MGVHETRNVTNPDEGAALDRTTECPIKVVAIVEGGVVQGALGSRPDIEFEVLDRDNYACAEVIDGETEDEADERVARECPHPIY